MVAYVTRRLCTSVVVLLLVSVIAYVGLAMAPGDELSARLGPEVVAQMSPQDVQAQRHALGLDRPLPVRYATWLGGVLHGDLGYSTSDGVPVAENLRTHLGPTLLLVGVALFFGTLAALLLGVVAALRQHTFTDYVLAALPLVLIGIPGLVLSLGAIYLFGVRLGVLPTSGMHTLGDESFGDLVRHLVLPAGVLAVGLAAPVIRYTRASMLDVLHSEFVTTARAKGLPGWRVVLGHAFRNALLPIVTVVGLALPDMVAGAVILEQVFGWPGMGQMAVRAAGNRDVAMTMGVLLVVAVAVTLANLVTDLVYVRADPRVRLVQS